MKNKEDMNTWKILCLMMMLLLFFTSSLSSGYALLHDGIENSSLQAVSTIKGKEETSQNAMIRGRKLRNGDQKGVKSENAEEFGKKMTKMNNSPKTKTRTSFGGPEVDEDGLVAYTADYWKARRHPPKNN